MDTTNTKNRKWLIFFGAGLMIFLINIDMTIVNLALATIAKNLHANMATIQWIINAYLLTTIIFFIVGGKLADHFGPKRIFLLGTVFFGIGSLIAGFASSTHILIIGRFVQGIGFAFTLSLALLMITHAFSPKQRGFILGLAITLTGLGQALGPTVGGVILTELSWHWIFLINIPIVLVSFILIVLFGHKATQKTKPLSLDYLGIVLLGAAIILLLLSLSSLTQTTIHVYRFIGEFIASIVLLVLFAVNVFKKDAPLFDLKLFLHRDYSFSILIRFFFMYTFSLFLFVIPLLLQNIIGHSPLIAGLIILLFSAILGICAPMAGLWCDSVGYRIPIVTAAILAVIAFLVLSTTVFHPTTYYLMWLALILFGFSVGLMIPATVNSTVSALPLSNRGEGLGMFFTIAFIGSSLGVALGGLVLNWLSWRTFTHIAGASLLSLTHPQMAILHSLANGTQNLNVFTHYFSHQQLMQLRPMIDQSFIFGFTVIMGINAILSILITIFGCLLQNRAKFEND